MGKEYLQQKTNLLLSQVLVYGSDNKRYVDWAIDLMQAEYVLEELDILAGWDDAYWDGAEKYFKKIAEKLEVALVEDDETLFAIYVNDVVAKVLSREISIVEAQKIICDYYYKSDCPSGYERIAYADDYWYLEEMNGGAKMTYEEFLMNEFRDLITNNNN